MTQATALVRPETAEQLRKDPRWKDEPKQRVRFVLPQEMTGPLKMYRPWPTRFTIKEEPTAPDGHKHQYGVKTLACEVERCRGKAPLRIERRDRVTALIKRMLRQQYLDTIEYDYPRVHEAPQGEAQGWTFYELSD